MNAKSTKKSLAEKLASFSKDELAFIKSVLLSEDVKAEKVSEKVSEKAEKRASASERASEEKSERKRNAEPAAYETDFLGASDFSQKIYASPKSEVGAKYFKRASKLASRVRNAIATLKRPPAIFAHVEKIAQKADANGGESLAKDLQLLASEWEIPAPAMRVIMQLCAPVVCACCTETDEIARRCYGMSRANALMGSACNSLMYSKAIAKETALPFIRTCRNFSRLGLELPETPASRSKDCEWYKEDLESFNEILTLCVHWLLQCIEKSEDEDEKPAPKKAGVKAAKKASVKDYDDDDDDDDERPAPKKAAKKPLHIKKQWAEADDLPKSRKAKKVFKK